MGREAITTLAYLLASVLFILGIKGLTHPRSAVRGNLMGALGMLIAVVATLIHQSIIEYHWIILGLIIGAIIGALLAIKVRMTAMPQMVALLNGFGGAASLLVAGAELIRTPPAAFSDVVIATYASGVIGAVTFWGSLLAFAKLEEYRAFRQPIRYPLLQPINAMLGIIALAMCAVGVSQPQLVGLYWGVVLVASILGLTLVNPIGGADMPVVIALLNSYSGLAAAATGFVLGNAVLIISGSLVGASGIILTNIMCKAMNRSMTNVLFGVLQAEDTAAKQDDVYRTVKGAAAEEIAMLFDTARRVVIVPGYGMAVAQAQHAVRDLYQILESRGVEVLFGIHPVAGRMPGHMNVLLAEAEIPYDRLKELDEVNSVLSETDVAIVLGANDVVNPLAKTDPKSPIAGMPIIEVDKAKTVVVIKRSLSPGFANIPNPLFAAENTLMFFADGKRAVLDLITAIKES